MGVIETAALALRRPLERFLPPKPTLVERQYRLGELLQQYPVRNETIWWLISVQRGFLTEKERDRIVRNFRTYRELIPHTNTPVADILAGANLEGFKGDRFFSRVCFNYDSAFGAEERYEAAIEDLQQGKRQMVGDSDTSLRSVERWVDYEFNRLHGSLSRDERFNRQVNAVETVYRATHLGITNFDPIWRELPTRVFPLLDVTEIIKPAPLTDWPYPERPARIAKLFGDAETAVLNR